MIDFFSAQMLAVCGYKNNNKIPVNWKQIGKTVVNNKNGFVGKVFYNEKTNEIVISVSGTDLSIPKSLGDLNNIKSDLSNNLNMCLGNLPPQFESAMLMYEDVKKKCPNVKITFVGHSLGGSIVQIIGKLTGEDVIAFSPFGTGNEEEYKNIINIGDTDDFIYMANINQQPGKTFIIPNDNNKIGMPKFNLVPKAHKIEDMNIIGLKKYKKGELVSFMDKLGTGDDHPYVRNLYQILQRIYKNWDNRNKRDSILGICRSSNEEKGKLFKGEDYDYNSDKGVLYGGVTLNGHWVTINGNHVFIED